MKLYDTKLELLVIKSICESKQKLKSKLLGSLDPSYFYSDAAKETIDRIYKLVRKESEVPSFKSLRSDPVISEASREILKKQKEYIEDSKTLQKSLKNLFKFKQARELYFISEKLNEELTKDKVNVEELIEYATTKVSKLKIKLSTEQEMFHFGKGVNSKSILARMLDDNPPLLVPSGFKDFDETNGGFAYGSLVGLGGPAGGGKTAIAIQIALNAARISREDVVYIPLEMDEIETSERIFANLAGIPIQFIKQKKLSKDQKRKIEKAEYKFNKNLKTDGTRFTIFSPYEGLTMTDALLAVKPFGYRVVILDYVGLLEGMTGDAQWQVMGEAAREAKIWAKANKAVVILLAQLDDKDHILRYSKVLKDHANNLWTWLVTDETRENKIMQIKQGKARNQKLFDFTLSYDDELYRVFDFSESNSSNNDKEKSDYLDSM